MENNNAAQDVSGILNSVGALSELLWLFYSNLLKQGFSRNDAFKLTHDYMIATFTGGDMNT